MSEQDDFLGGWKAGDKDDAIPSDRFDRAAWNGIRMESPTLEEMIERLKADHNYVDDFGTDIFNLLHQGGPIVRSQAEMNPTHIPLRDATDEFSQAPDVEELRQRTAGDAFNTALAMAANEKAMEEVLKRAKALEEQAAEAQQAQDEAQQKAAQGDPGAGAAAQAAQGLIQSLQHASEAAAKAAGAEIRKGVKQALTEIEDMEDRAAGYGMEPGAMQRMSFEERLALGKKLNSGRMKAFADLLGRFRQLATAEWRNRVVEGSDEIVGVKLGNDLTRLTSGEFINLAVPELEEDFWVRYANHELLIHEMVGRERVGKGPIVYLGDESASMDGAPEMWMKGLALAMLDQARRGKRDFTYIGFASGYDDLRVFHFPEGKVDFPKTVDMVEGFLRGGTNFEKPFRLALDIVKGAGKNKPDIVFATDGGGPTVSFLDEWREVREKLSVKCHAIFIGASPRHIDGLTAMADTVRAIGDVADVTAVADILRT